MSKKLPVYQVYGANTEVGKTIFSTLLARTVLKGNQAAYYIKPVSTGPDQEADINHLMKYAPQVKAECFIQYTQPVSPHLAVVADSQQAPSDSVIVEGVYKRLAEIASMEEEGTAFVETAGGVLSPGPSGSTQANLYRALRLPALLVGDSRLGGISSTLSALESLKIRGYDTPLLVLFENEVYKNHEYFKESLAKKLHVTSVPAPPSRAENAPDDIKQMKEYYEEICNLPVMKHTGEYLQDVHAKRISDLATIKQRANDTIWYPFSQHTLINPDNITAIDSAHGDFFQTVKGSTLESQFDASASWWTQGLGHGNPDLAITAAYAAGRYGHTILAGTIHQPAMELAEKILKVVNNPRLSRVFYSDNGSTGVEVGLKMALKATCARYGWNTDSDEYQKLGILGLKRSYHGDTIGTMDCCEPSAYNKQVNWYQERGYWLDYPVIKQKDAKWLVESAEGVQVYESLDDIFDLQNRKETLAAYEREILDALKKELSTGKIFGAVMLEPVLLGAGGMLAVDPLFQHALVKVVRENPTLFGTGEGEPGSWSGLPVIFDEVFTGLYRLGHATAASLIQVEPDISVHAKLLTGGVVPLCVTLASENIFKSFLSAKKVDGLLHGHSYTAHPVGCAVALESLNKFEELDMSIYRDSWNNSAIWSMWNQNFVEQVSKSDKVEGVFAMGSVLAISLKDSQGAGRSIH